MFAPLVTPVEMAEWDKRAVREYGLRGEMLMENASRECLAVLREELGALKGRSAVLFAGPGNNGGDAMGLARCLDDAGVSVRILHTRPKSAYRREAGFHLGLARKAGLSMVLLQRVNLETLPFADIVVDGLLGTGFSGTLRAEYLNWIRTINELRERAFVLALDIPSGLDGLTGRPRPEAVRAHATVSFEAAKPGLMEPVAREFVGRLHVRPIGIPRALREARPPVHFSITRNILELVGKPSPLLHKGRAGHALVIGGSDGLTGAPALAALGALRAGAGLVTVASPAGIMDTVKAGFPEFMALPLGRGGDGPPPEESCHVPAHAAWPRCWNRSMAREIVVQMPRFQGRGPGAGGWDEAGIRWNFWRNCLPHLPAGSVLDADALFWLGQDRKLRERLPADMILTPHLGEMARLVGRPVADIEADRAPVARDLARELSAVVVLKGPCTLVAEPGGRTHVSPVMAPLSGHGRVRRRAGRGAGRPAGRGGLAPLPCACLGVYWHGPGRKKPGKRTSPARRAGPRNRGRPARSPQGGPAMLTAKDIMTPNPITLSPDDDVLTAVRLMLEKKINGLPVVDDKGALLGVLCQSDLVARQKTPSTPTFFAILDGFIPLGSQDAFERDLQKIAAATVGEAMTPGAISIGPDTPLETIANYMVDGKLYSLPVVDKGKVVGIVGKEDVLRTLLKEK